MLPRVIVVADIAEVTLRTSRKEQQQSSKSVCERHRDPCFTGLIDILRHGTVQTLSTQALQEDGEGQLDIGKATYPWPSEGTWPKRMDGFGSPQELNLPSLVVADAGM